MLPESGCSSNPAMFTRVDLPAPEGPSNATISPLLMEKFAPFKMFNSCFPERKVLEMPLSSITGVGTPILVCTKKELLNAGLGFLMPKSFGVSFRVIPLMPTMILFITKHLYRIEFRRAPCRVKCGKKSQTKRHKNYADDFGGVNFGGNAGKEVYLGGE